VIAWLIGLCSASELRVEVDPRVELVSVVFRLAGSPSYNRDQGDYAQAVDAWFEPHARHTAVKMARKLRVKRGIAYNAPIDLAVHADPLMRPLVPLDPLPPRLDDRWSPRDAERFLAKLRDFAVDSDFAAFFEAQEPARREAEAAIREAGGEQVVTWLEGTFGEVEGASYVVHPGLLVGGHNYGVSAEVDDRVIFSPVLGTGSSGRGVEYLLVHELGHAFVNPPLNAHSELLEEGGRHVYRPVAAQMRQMAYGEWKIVVNETGVRALTVLYALDTYGVRAGREALDREIGAGFAWTGEVVSWLDDLRREGPVDLAASAAGLGEVLAGWSATSDSSFRGPINAAFDRLEGGVLHSSHPYGDAMNERFAQLPAEGEGVRPELWYGTPADEGLAARLKDFGIVLDAAGVEVDGVRYGASSPRVIVTRPHPEDASLPVVIYAAWDPADVEGINSLFHGPTDWLVADGDQTLATGNYASDLPLLEAERLGISWPVPDLDALPGWLALVGPDAPWPDVTASAPMIVMGDGLPAYEELDALGSGRMTVGPAEEGRFGCDGGSAVTVTPLTGADHSPGLAWLVEPGTDAEALPLERFEGEKHVSWAAGGHELVLTKTGELSAELSDGSSLIEAFDISEGMTGYEPEPLVPGDGWLVPTYGAAWRLRDHTVFGGWWWSFEGIHFEVVTFGPSGLERTELAYLYSCAF